ncbi:hypothetical protein BH10PSE16_BH10PSE16_01260 [soil metagenome]
MANTKKDQIKLIYTLAADYVVHGCGYDEIRGLGELPPICVSMDEFIERLCSAFEKVNDRVAGW